MTYPWHDEDGEERWGEPEGPEWPEEDAPPMYWMWKRRAESEE